MFRFASLGSGSKGNALLIEAGSTRVLLDCGFGPRNLEQRCARLGVLPDSLDAIIVTHEHSDHIGGAFPCARQFDATLCMTHGTHAAFVRNKVALGKTDVRLQLIDSHAAFAIGDLQIQPFPVPHDAREPVQCVFSDGNHRLGVLTDLGFSTPHVVAQLSGCDALVLECNHDADMLAGGDYPPSLKQRIGGRFGHLDNATAAALLSQLDRSRLRHLVAAHLSEHNNTPTLARQALAEVMACDAEWIGIADQETGFDWRVL
ncbi:MAG TPA: MBL fold metallo-hydrolase [Rhodocyclaceae bacterium]|nr:MBL fold metallo-hydrolase [Rhodocyclaceae bacterium]